jgi:hypothetical protein
MTVISPSPFFKLFGVIREARTQRTEPGSRLAVAFLPVMGSILGIGPDLSPSDFILSDPGEW